MNRKKRIIIYSVAILLVILGFICIAIAATPSDVLNKNHVNIIGLSSFVFWGLSVALLIKNFTSMVTSEMEEMADKMHNETDFFSMVSINENPQTLTERFTKSGFKLQQGDLHKRQFSFAKDYINYYVAIVQEEDIIEYFNGFLKNIENLLQDQSRFHKNNIIYIFFFNQNITPDELDFLKKFIINQEVIQGLPGSFDAVLPIVYDTTNQKYIIRKPKRRFSIALFDIALRKYYKMIKSTNI